MLTGVETAGVILAVFPLVISALEHYREGFEPLKDWWKFRTEFLTLIHSTGLQSVRFLENIEEILSPIVESDEEYDALMKDPGGPAWRNPEMEERLRRRLPKSYEWYCATIEEMNGVMTKLMGKLDIRPANANIKESWTKYVPGSGFKWDYELKRIRFCLSKKKRERLLDAIKKYNGDLQELLGSSERLAPLRRRRASKAATVLQKVREQASGLYKALSGSLKCPCASQHTTNLFLQHRADSDFNQNQQDNEFIVMFEGPAMRTNDDRWKEFKIVVSENQAPFSLEPNEVKIKTRNTIDQTLSSVRMDFGRKSSLKKHYTASSKSVGFQLQASSTSTTLVSSYPEIVDLCSTISTEARDQAPIACLRHAQSQFIFHPGSRCRKEALKIEFLTLGSILKKDRKQDMSRRDRAILAVTLASSVLQLHSTHWLKPNWGKSDVTLVLFKNDCGASSIQRTTFVDPSLSFVSHNFTSGQSVPDEPLSGDSREILLRLGIVLLELCFGQALEDQVFRQNYLGPNGKPNKFTDRATASEWQECALGEGGELFATATRRCIDCAFGSSSTDLGNAEFRQAVHDNVVIPLQEVMKSYGTA